MHASLDQGGARWERLQYARAGSEGVREYRSTNAAMLKLERVAMKYLFAVPSNAGHWEVLPLGQRTVGRMSTSFQLSSTLACGLSKKHVRVHSAFPYTAFKWLASPIGLQAEYDRIGCKQVLGSWLKGWCEYWTRNGGLDSRGAAADLTAIIILLQDEMGEIEANHASIRRELVVLSTQTHSCGFLELSERFVLRCCRRNPEKYGVVSAGCCDKAAQLRKRAV
jgi:hypothetical protein